MIKNSYYSIYRRLWESLSKKRKNQILFGLVLIVISAFVEMLTLVSVFPLLQLLISNESNFSFDSYSFLTTFFGINSSANLLFFTIIFLVITISSAITRSFNNFYNLRLFASIGSEIGALVFKNTINKSYEEQINDNSSKLISLITTHVGSTITSMEVLFNLFNYGVLSIFIIFGMLSINFKITILSLFIFSTIYLSITLITKKKIFQVGKFAAEANLKIINYVQESLGSIRDIILDNNQDFYIDRFVSLNFKKYLAVANTQFLFSVPKHLIEALGLAFIAIIAYYFQEVSNNSTLIISSLGAFALGVQKLLPAVHQVYSSYSNIKFNIYPVNLVLDILNSNNYEKFHNIRSKFIKNFRFENIIEFKNVDFSYRKNTKILSNLNFKIYKGEKVGIIGKTGCGKSTLVDLIMGLLSPSSGNILIDDTDLSHTKNLDFLLQWRSIISHVPQEIYISDTNFLENIAFGIKDEFIDYERVKNISKLAKLYDYIVSTKDKFLSKVGERGIQLSGGQKQRIGISRAFYRDSQIIVFDEATSALDNLTEREVMNAIYEFNSDITIIIIAHRLSSIAGCDKVIFLEDGRIKKIGPPEEVIKLFDYNKN